MRYPLAMLVVAACAGASAAQDYTRIDVEGSSDNVNWAGGTIATSPGSTIYVRIRVSKAGPATVAGFAGCTIQPVIEAPFGGLGELALLPLSNPTTGAAVVNNSGVPANLGRLLPFGVPGMATGSSAGLLTSLGGELDGRQLLRFAGSRSTTPTVNLAWGVQLAQLSPQLAGGSFSPGDSAVVFKCGVQIGQTTGLYVVDVPYALINSARNPTLRWFTSNTGGGSPRSFLADPAQINALTIYAAGNPCIPGFQGTLTWTSHSMTVLAGRRASLRAREIRCAGAAHYQWFRQGEPVADDGRIHGANDLDLIIENASPTDTGAYTLRATFGTSTVQSSPITLAVVCPADLDDGSGGGTTDQGVDISDLIYFVTKYEAGNVLADLDDGSDMGVPDQGVTIDDLLYFLRRFELGC